MFPNFAAAIVLLIVCAVIVWIFRNWKTGESSGGPRPPSLPSLPLVGSLPFLRNANIFEFFMEKSNQLGPIFTFRAGNKLVLILNTKEAIEETLMKNPTVFASRPTLGIIHGVTPNYNGFQFAPTTTERKRIHETVTSVMKEFGFGTTDKMQEIILREVESMREFAKQNTGKLLESGKLSIQMTSNIIMNMLFNTRRGYDEEILELYLELVQFGISLDVSGDIAPLLQYLPRYREKISTMKNCTKKIHSDLDTLIEAMTPLEPKKNSFVQRYIEKEGPCYDREQLIFVLRDIIFGGTVTTAIALQWLLVALANHPEVQKKIQTEIDSTIPRGRLPNMGDQANLRYVQATVLEMFRWRTILPLSLPRITMKDSTVNDYFIPANTMVLSNQYAVHNDAKLWTEPSDFRPERFLDKDNNIINKHQVVPFGLGQRSCFGQVLVRAELFLIISSLMQRFTIELPDEGKKVSDEPLQPVAVVAIPRPFAFRLIERN